MSSNELFSNEFENLTKNTVDKVRNRYSVLASYRGF